MDWEKLIDLYHNFCTLDEMAKDLALTPRALFNVIKEEGVEFTKVGRRGTTTIMKDWSIELDLYGLTEDRPAPEGISYEMIADLYRMKVARKKEQEALTIKAHEAWARQGGEFEEWEFK